MKLVIVAFSAPMLLALSAGSAAQAPRPATPASALDFTVEAITQLCRVEGNSLESAQQILPRGWRLTDTADHYDKDFGVDAPVPLQNQHERGWRGPLGDGRASLSVDVTDYRDPALRDRFSARLMVAPETAIDLEILQRRLGMTLRPQGPAHQGRGSDFSALSVNGVPGPTFPRRYGQIQHFILEPAPAGMEIEATRAWGSGFAEQWFRVTCRPAFGTTAD